MAEKINAAFIKMVERGRVAGGNEKEELKASILDFYNGLDLASHTRRAPTRVIGCANRIVELAGQLIAISRQKDLNSIISWRYSMMAFAWDFLSAFRNCQLYHDPLFLENATNEEYKKKITKLLDYVSIMGDTPTWPEIALSHPSIRHIVDLIVALAEFVKIMTTHSS